MNNPPNHRQLIGALIVIAVTVLATVIVVVTGTTAGLVDLATLVLTISSVLIPLVQGRRSRHRRR
jgi:hypothetical protein